MLSLIAALLHLTTIRFFAQFVQFWQTSLAGHGPVEIGDCYWRDRMSGKAWAGLDAAELRRLELVFCPPTFRAQLLEAPVNEPLARCGYTLGKILGQVEHINAQRTGDRRRPLPRNKELAELLD